MATHPAAAAHAVAPPIAPADVERWLADLGIEPLDRVDREGVVAWDVELDGRRRLDLRITVILDPALGLICWLHYAPPIGDAFRKSYRRLLRWNDEFPFVKFSLAEDERPVLAVELPLATLDAEELGTALVRLVSVADRLLDESLDWLWIGGRMPAGYADRRGRNDALIDRFRARLPELVVP